MTNAATAAVSPEPAPGRGAVAGCDGVAVPRMEARF
jgi:hypothetical protein